MVKQPVTVDRFRIIAETDAENMGPLLAQLTRMGLEKISYELITDIRTFNQRKAFDIAAEEFASAWIADHPTFAVKELGHHFKADGRSVSGAHKFVRMATEKGLLKSLGDGNYSHPDVKGIAPPAEARPGNRSHVRTGRFEVSGEQLIWGHIKNRKSFTTGELRELFRSNGRVGGSYSPLLTKMARAKLIKKTGDGTYSVLKKPAAPAKKVKSIASAKRPQPGTPEWRESERQRKVVYRAGKKAKPENNQQPAPPEETPHG